MYLEYMMNNAVFYGLINDSLILIRQGLFMSRERIFMVI